MVRLKLLKYNLFENLFMENYLKLKKFGLVIIISSLKINLFVRILNLVIMTDNLNFFTFSAKFQG